MDDLISNWNRLTLSEREGSRCYLEKDLSSEELIIAAQFFTKRNLNKEAITRTFNHLWWSQNGFQGERFRLCLGGGSGMEWNEMNIFRILFPPLV